MRRVPAANELDGIYMTSSHAVSLARAT